MEFRWSSDLAMGRKKDRNLTDKKQYLAFMIMCGLTGTQKTDFI